MTDIQTWLASHDLAKYAAEFIAQDVSVDLLADLTDDDLRELGVASLGDRKRLRKAATPVVSVSAVPAATAAAPVPAVGRQPVPNEEGERRHGDVLRPHRIHRAQRGLRSGGSGRDHVTHQA